MSRQERFRPRDQTPPGRVQQQVAGESPNQTKKPKPKPQMQMQVQTNVNGNGNGNGNGNQTMMKDSSETQRSRHNRLSKFSVPMANYSPGGRSIRASPSPSQTSSTIVDAGESDENASRASSVTSDAQHHPPPAPPFLISAQSPPPPPSPSRRSSRSRRSSNRTRKSPSKTSTSSRRQAQQQQQQQQHCHHPTEEGTQSPSASTNSVSGRGVRLAEDEEFAILNAVYSLGPQSLRASKSNSSSGTTTSTSPRLFSGIRRASTASRKSQGRTTSSSSSHQLQRRHTTTTTSRTSSSSSIAHQTADTAPIISSTSVDASSSRNHRRLPRSRSTTRHPEGEDDDNNNNNNNNNDEDTPSSRRRRTRSSSRDILASRSPSGRRSKSQDKSRSAGSGGGGGRGSERWHKSRSKSREAATSRTPTPTSIRRSSSREVASLSPSRRRQRSSTGRLRKVRSIAVSNVPITTTTTSTTTIEDQQHSSKKIPVSPSTPSSPTRIYAPRRDSPAATAAAAGDRFLGGGSQRSSRTANNSNMNVPLDRNRIRSKAAAATALGEGGSRSATTTMTNRRPSRHRSLSADAERMRNRVRSKAAAAASSSSALPNNDEEEASSSSIIITSITESLRSPGRSTSLSRNLNMDLDRARIRSRSNDAERMSRRKGGSSSSSSSVTSNQNRAAALQSPGSSGVPRRSRVRRSALPQYQATVAAAAATTTGTTSSSPPTPNSGSAHSRRSLQLTLTRGRSTDPPLIPLPPPALPAWYNDEISVGSTTVQSGMPFSNDSSGVVEEAYDDEHIRQLFTKSQSALIYRADLEEEEEDGVKGDMMFRNHLSSPQLTTSDQDAIDVFGGVAQDSWLKRAQRSFRLSMGNARWAERPSSTADTFASPRSRRGRRPNKGGGVMTSSSQNRKVLATSSPSPVADSPATPSSMRRKRRSQPSPMTTQVQSMNSPPMHTSAGDSEPPISASPTLEQLLASRPGDKQLTSSLADPSICKSSSSSSLNGDRFLISTDGAGGHQQNHRPSSPTGDRFAHHLRKPLAKFAPPASLIDPSVCSSTVAVEDGILRKAGKSARWSSINEPTRPRIQKSRSFGDVSSILANVSHHQPTHLSSLRSVTQMEDEGDHSFSCVISDESEEIIIVQRLNDSIGTSGEVGDSAEGETEGRVRVIRTTRRGSSSTVGLSDDDSFSEEETAQDEYLQLCLPAPTTAPTTTPTTAIDAVTDQSSKVGGLFKRMHRRSSASPRVTLGRKPLIPPLS